MVRKSPATLTLTEGEHLAVEEAAARTGLSRARWLRMAVVSALGLPLEPQIRPRRNAANQVLNECAIAGICGIFGSVCPTPAECPERIQEALLDA